MTYIFQNLNLMVIVNIWEKKDKGHNHRIEQCISDLIVYCRKIKPYVYFYKQQIKSLNDTAHDILNNELNITLPKFPEDRKGKRSIFATLISGFTGLAYEGISSFLHNRRHKVLHNAVKAIDNQASIQCNTLWKILWNIRKLYTYSISHAQFYNGYCKIICRTI